MQSVGTGCQTGVRVRPRGREARREPQLTTSIIRERSLMVALLNSMPILRITPASAEGDGAERRVFPRKEVSGHVESRRCDHTIEAQRNPHLSLTLRDLSLGGLSAI